MISLDDFIGWITIWVYFVSFYDNTEKMFQWWTGESSFSLYLLSFSFIRDDVDDVINPNENDWMILVLFFVFSSSCGSFVLDCFRIVPHFRWLIPTFSNVLACIGKENRGQLGIVKTRRRPVDSAWLSPSFCFVIILDLGKITCVCWFLPVYQWRGSQKFQNNISPDIDSTSVVNWWITGWSNWWSKLTS